MVTVNPTMHGTVTSRKDWEQKAEPITPKKEGEKKVEAVTPKKEGEKKVEAVTPKGGEEKKVKAVTPTGGEEKKTKTVTSKGGGEKKTKAATPKKKEGVTPKQLAAEYDLEPRMVRLIIRGIGIKARGEGGQGGSYSFPLESSQLASVRTALKARVEKKAEKEDEED